MTGAQPCDFCGAPGRLIPVGPDMTFESETRRLVTRKPPAFAVGVACDDHVALVRMRLEERVAPKYVKRREGRP